MNEQELRRILTAGLGRAILFARDNDITPFRDIALYACTYGLQFDRQIEGERSWYLLKLIEQTGEGSWYRDQILAALTRTPTDPELDADQLYAFASRYATSGDDGARRAMYEGFVANAAGRTRSAQHGEGVEYFIDLDGLPGLLFIADTYGQWLLEDSEAWFSHWSLRYAESLLGEQIVADALQDAVATNPRIAAFVRHIREQREEQPKPRVDPTTWTYEEVRSRIAEYAKRGNKATAHSDLRRWGQRASDADVWRAAEDLLKETDPERLYALISIFGRRTFPLAPERLIALARTAPDAPSEGIWQATLTENIAWSAARALANVDHPVVRELGLDLIRTDHLVERGTYLLRSNYHDGDQALLEACLRRSANDETFHSVGLDVLQIFKTRPVPESVDVLTLIYERGPCSHCRERALDLLAKLGPLPDWIIVECRFDANADIREWIESYPDTATDST